MLLDELVVTLLVDLFYGICRNTFSLCDLGNRHITRGAGKVRLGVGYKKTKNRRGEKYSQDERKRK